jgi:hypothetical protein
LGVVDSKRRDEQRRKYSKMDKWQRISLLGHLERIEKDRIPKKDLH